MKLFRYIQECWYSLTHLHAHIKSQASSSGLILNLPKHAQYIMYSFYWALLLLAICQTAAFENVTDHAKNTETSFYKKMCCRVAYPHQLISGSVETVNIYVLCLLATKLMSLNVRSRFCLWRDFLSSCNSSIDISPAESKQSVRTQASLTLSLKQETFHFYFIKSQILNSKDTVQ